MTSKQAIGLMSGTSLDGIDAALIATDGENVVVPEEVFSLPYPSELRAQLRELLEGRGDVLRIEKCMTELHAEAVYSLLSKADISPEDVSVIGFHGQTIIHRPDEGLTQQIGNGALLAHLTGIDVVGDFRRRDMAAGGQGAPLVPIYHAAIARNAGCPVALINIGGVANVTFIGKDNQLLAFDTGAGNALLDDWIFQHTGEIYDKDGLISGKGTVVSSVVDEWMHHPYFKKKPPKSLDRNSFSIDKLKGISLEDGAATLVMFTVESIAQAVASFPEMVQDFYIAGGGRHNPTILAKLQERLNTKILPVEALGLDGDMLEAQAFGYLAVRSLRGLPLTFPLTTGVKCPTLGGAFYRA